MSKSQSNSNFFYDQMDQAAMLLYNELHLDYLSCLLRVAHDLTYEINDQGLHDTTPLEVIYKKLKRGSFLNEDIRVAFNLLLVKAIKEQPQLSLDCILPDAIGMLFAHILQPFIETNPTILDVTLQTGNLLYTLYNQSTNACVLYGIEPDYTFVQIASVAAELQEIPITIYQNDLFDSNPLLCDILIGHFPSQIEDKSYKPYHQLLQSMTFLQDNGLFALLIDNDYFDHHDFIWFKQQFEGTLLGLIVLPSSLFQDHFIGKSILIGSKKHIDVFEMMVSYLPHLYQTDDFKYTMNKINQWIQQTKGIIQ